MSNNIKEQLIDNEGKYFKYTRDTTKEGIVTRTGKLTRVDDKYAMFSIPDGSYAWSVVYEDIIEISPISA
mgnify:CR=1 FL=1